MEIELEGEVQSDEDEERERRRVMEVRKGDEMRRRWRERESSVDGEKLGIRQYIINPNSHNYRIALYVDRVEYSPVQKNVNRYSTQ